MLKFSTLQRLMVLLNPKNAGTLGTPKSRPLLPRISGINNQLPDVQEAGGPYAQTVTTEFIDVMKHLTQRSSEHGNH